jgi:hypothetical protein
MGEGEREDMVSKGGGEAAYVRAGGARCARRKNHSKVERRKEIPLYAGCAGEERKSGRVRVVGCAKEERKRGRV